MFGQKPRLKVLEALALAQLPRRALLSKLAMLWRREHGTRISTKDIEDPAKELLSWVKGNYGGVFPPEQEARWTTKLRDEIERQHRARVFKDRVRGLMIPESNTVPARRGRMLNKILGLPILWATRKRLAGDGIYFTGVITLDFVAGLVATEFKLRGRHLNRLLVYRAGKSEPKAYWVGPVNKIEQALTWLMRPAVYRAKQKGAKVIFDGDAQVYRLIYPDGRRTRVRWRKLADFC